MEVDISVVCPFWRESLTCWSCTALPALSALHQTPILKLRRFNRKTHGFRSFSCFGPHIWNSLPQDVRHSNCIPSLKNRLKTYLFSEHFNWVLLSFAPTVSTVFACVWRVCVCVGGVCVDGWVGVYIYSFLCLCIVAQLCWHNYEHLFPVSMYMYVFNLYRSTLWATG